MKLRAAVPYLALVLAATLIALAGCERHEGPAERAGKQIDATVTKAGEQIEKAGDRIEDAAKDARR